MRLGRRAPRVPEPLPVGRAEAVYAARLAQLVDSDWTALREALQRLEAAGAFGSWTDSRKLADGSWQLPYTTLSDEAEVFLATVSRLGLYIPFDWMAWERALVALKIISNMTVMPGHVLLCKDRRRIIFPTSFQKRGA